MDYMQVFRLKLLGDDGHPTRIAFIEFAEVTLSNMSILNAVIFAHWLAWI